jgi:transposase
MVQEVPMGKRTTLTQRRTFYELHEQGLTYAEIAEQYEVSAGCVRYWYRRQRDGGSCKTTYRKTPTGILSHFHWLVRYHILRMRLEHPRWGPVRIRHHLQKHPSLRGLMLPSRTQIGRYLHQWPRFRRKRKKKTETKRPNPPTKVHQRWQVDFKINIALQDGSAIDLHTIRDPFGEACIEAVVHPTQLVTIRTKRVPMEAVRATLRRGFGHWQTLPEEVQTDGETTLVSQKGDAFPSTFTLWLTGLGIKHLVIHQVTENAEVERCHRTINDYAIVGNEKHSATELQSILDQAVEELTYELPSRAKGCAGRAPIEAHPELEQPERPFLPERELATFSLGRVDLFLSTFAWTRKVGKTGQITIGGQGKRYSVGRAYARQEVLVRFDPTDRHFVFHLPDPEQDDLDVKDLPEIGRRPARNLEIEDLTGLATWPEGLLPQQLPLPLCFVEG